MLAADFIVQGKGGSFSQSRIGGCGQTRAAKAPAGWAVRRSSLMSVISKSSVFLFPLAMLAVPVTLAAQQAPSWSDSAINVYGERLPPRSEMTEGPKIEGIISARKGDRIQVTAEDGTRSTIFVSQDTKIRSKGGFLGLSSNKLATDSLLNGLPVSVATLQWSGGLFADKVDLKNKDLKVASMIRNGTDQRFAEQTAATEALRSRVADIDNYNVKQTTNVNFDVGRADLSADAKSNLCATANTAAGMDNALLLVVGYTDLDRKRRAQPGTEREAGDQGRQLSPAVLRLEALPHADPDRDVRGRPAGGQ